MATESKEQIDVKYTETSLTTTAMEESINEVYTGSKEKFLDDKEFEKKLVRKIDIRLVPILTILYLLSFLDRVNIGNAKLAHIERDLGLVGDQFNWCLSIFFIGYLLFEVPSNLVLLKTSPSTWLPFIMIAWGISMLLMAFSRSFSGLMAARFFLGVFEAGLFPGAVYYITTWYKRSEQNSRMALFSVATAFAGSFSGLLAYSVLSLEGKGNLRGWQWLFIIEGLMTIVISAAAYFLMSDFPEKAKWLSDNERKFAIERLKNDVGKAHVSHFDKKQFVAALTDWKVYSEMVHLGLCSIPLYSFALFLPSIVNGMGFNFVISQLLSAPPFFLSGISTIIVAILSDRKRVRGPFVIIFSFIAILGYILLIIPTTGIAGKYIGICTIGIGLSPTIVTSITWLANNVAGHVKRGIATALVVMSGNVGGIVASQIYQQKDFPHYYSGHSIAMSFLFIATWISAFQYFFLSKINKRKRENPQSFLQGKSEEEIKQMGDLHPDFIYCL